MHSKTNSNSKFEISSFDEKPREACGIFGIYDHTEAAALTYFGIYALQHRGQESAGIAVAAVVCWLVLTKVAPAESDDA